MLEILERYQAAEAGGMTDIATTAIIN